MYYYKHPDGGYISCSSPIGNYEEVTEAEFNEHVVDEEIEDDSPTYEELEEENARLLYQLLTGEEFE